MISVPFFCPPHLELLCQPACKQHFVQFFSAEGCDRLILAFSQIHPWQLLSLRSLPAKLPATLCRRALALTGDHWHLICRQTETHADHTPSLHSKPVTVCIMTKPQ